MQNTFITFLLIAVIWLSFRCAGLQRELDEFKRDCYDNGFLKIVVDKNGIITYSRLYTPIELGIMKDPDGDNGILRKDKGK